MEQVLDFIKQQLVNVDTHRIQIQIIDRKTGRQTAWFNDFRTDDADYGVEFDEQD